MIEEDLPSIGVQSRDEYLLRFKTLQVQRLLAAAEAIIIAKVDLPRYAVLRGGAVGLLYSLST